MVWRKAKKLQAKEMCNLVWNGTLVSLNDEAKLDTIEEMSFLSCRR